MAVATYQDVEVALGRPISTTAEQAQVGYWLDGIELLIAARLGAVSDLDQDVLLYVETEAVVGRIKRNAAAGTSSITVSVDDGSVTRRFDGVNSSDINDEWWRLLDPTWGSGAFSIRPYFEPDDVDPLAGWA